MKAVTIVGSGALGSHLCLLLRNEDIALRVVDDDRVESKNVLSQFHVKQSVGKNKAQALAQTMLGLFGAKVESIPHRLTADNVDTLLGKSDLVIDALDNAASRRLVQDYVRGSGIECLHGALAAEGGFGRVVWTENFVVDEEASAGAATCHAGEHLAFVALTAALLARSVHVWLATGKKVGYEVTPGAIFPT